MCVRILNIIMKVVFTLAISAGMLKVIFSEVEPKVGLPDIIDTLFYQSFCTFTNK